MENTAQGTHICEFDSLRIEDFDGRLFRVCLECGARKYLAELEKSNNDDNLLRPLR